MYRVELKVLRYTTKGNGAQVFLMYRVELKVNWSGSSQTSSRVPNVPCGVESVLWFPRQSSPQWFLMYRVELKVFEGRQGTSAATSFLMYRVELKDLQWARDNPFIEIGS